ncbi:Na(+)/H(+) antiporter subunit F1 [Niallia sp. Krafla_26]|uniref:Na(+)/H(+) antiporter subunit F1 n=1 Tax=Niallia sp. Krafla_26 TaxID=3064703 RepID=UPI003D172A9D
MFKMILITSLVMITLSILAAIYRAVKGPSTADRVQALDFIGTNIIASIAIFSIILHTHAFFDVILLIGILSFVGTIAFARYVERGVVIERNNK